MTHTPAAMRAHVSQRLVELRGNRKQGVVARALNVSQSVLSRVERGHRLPDLWLLIAITRYYRCSITDIVPNEEERQ